MQRAFILFLSLFIFKLTNAQLALIKDPDGFSNVRQSANSQSKVLDTLSNDRIVFVFEEQAEGNWVPIDYKKGNQSFSGNIHKSRITFLNDLTKFKVVTLNDSLLKLRLDSTQITMSKRRFISKGRQIKYEKPKGEQQYVKFIDGKFPWGTDGNIPRTEYKQIQLKSSSLTLTFPAITLRDLFEPNLDMTSAYIDKATNKIYIEAFNSDAAGGYVVVWTLKNGQIINRETFIPF